MDWAGVAAFLTALGTFFTVAIPVVVKAFREIKALRKSNDVMWASLVKRGFLEAASKQHIKKVAGVWQVTDEARKAFAPIVEALRDMRQRLVHGLGKEPDDDELGAAIEMEYQDWLVENICPALKVNQHGCLAIACVLAREDGPADLKGPPA